MSWNSSPQILLDGGSLSGNQLSEMIIKPKDMIIEATRKRSNEEQVN